MKEARIVYHSAKDIRNDPRFKPGCSLRVKDKGIVYPYEAISQSPAVDLLMEDYEFVTVTEAPVLKVVTGYVNVYKDFDGNPVFGGVHKTLEKCKSFSASRYARPLLGRVKLIGIEGVFEE